jgi:hypothetical protein
MGLGQDRGEQRTGLTYPHFTSHVERHSESVCSFPKNTENGFHNHVDARSCQWMVVIMDYDMEGHGRYNPEEEGE